MLSSVAGSLQRSAVQQIKLPEILVYDVGANFPMELAERVGDRAYKLLQAATGGTSKRKLRLADSVSRRWLERNGSPYLAEIDALAQRSLRPGIYYLNASYEWGCTTAARPSIEGTSALLQRTLDWDVNGIGRYVVAARIANPLGAWISFTWPAFTGVIQAVAPGRFAAAINQPTLAWHVGLLAADRLIALYRIWSTKHIQPVHLLRRVFETAPDFQSALAMLQTVPISSPVIFTLAGITADQTATIERLPTEYRTTADAFAANEWRAFAGRVRSHAAFENEARLGAARTASAQWDPNLGWVCWPILNRETRLAMMAEPVSGRIIARGYENGAPATRDLILHEAVG